MMEKAKISVVQLFAIMFMFDLGTVLVVSYGINGLTNSNNLFVPSLTESSCVIQLNCPYKGAKV
ncbi:hypothetical protein AF332_16475 [Sporosarcina globispora]|uniref:Uncharacterized protein n=1 Tax=Sporosarcina globispora TaxID=1459 RepID=A0A0M0GFM7_SPOGL|nr:hypothetical protein [Sporosarcina globispora]KON88241.1 hypothetical protein AF332_16475 [Sporosarcina globispora]